MASASEICGICEARNILVLALEFCPDCEDKLCKGCIEHHSISKDTRNHSTISIGNYNELPQFIRDIKQHCTEHNKLYQKYCINHDVPLCKKCTVTTHKYCKDTTTLEAMTTNAKSSVAADVIESRMADVHLNIQNILIDRKEYLQMIIENEKHIEKEISDDRTVINGLFDKLEQQVKAQSETIKSRLENVIADFETKDTKLKQTLDYISQIKLYASEFQVFLGMKEIENQVKIAEENIESMLMNGSLNNLILQCQKMEMQYAKIGRIVTEENTSKLRIVRREVKQAQQLKQTKSNCKKKANNINHGENYWAQCRHDSKGEGTLTLAKGDIVTVLDNSDPDWWRVRKYDTRNEITIDGLVYAKSLTQDDLYFHEWFFGPASQEEKGKMILGHGKISGSFLVTESTEGGYILSVLYLDTSTDERVVEEHIIYHNNVKGYYLSHCSKKFFCNLSELIKSCIRTRPVNLTQPLGMAIADSLEIAKDSVAMNTLLHFGQFRDIWQGVLALVVGSHEKYNVSKIPFDFGTLNSSEQVAVAAFKTGPRSKIAFASEIYVLRQCRHDCIIKLYGVYSCDELTYMITELAGKGNLLNVLRTGEGKKWKFPRLVEIASQIADGMSYLERKKFVHKYLAAKHVLLVGDKNIKITDFQLTIQDVCCQAADENKIKWIAPEAAILGNFSTKSDVWSFGIVLVELILHGQVPYPDVKNNEVIGLIKKGFRHPKPQNCSENLYEVMMSCWKTEPERRPTFEYLFSAFDDYFISVEPYYEEIDEDTLS